MHPLGAEAYLLKEQLKVGEKMSPLNYYSFLCLWLSTPCLSFTFFVSLAIIFFNNYVKNYFIWVTAN